MWGSRFGNWTPSRWSPFTSRGDPANTRVTDSDFSYITSDDLARHVDGSRQHSGQPRRSSNLSATRAARDNDIVLFRHQKVSYPVHFPPYSIDDGQLAVGQVRAEAAETLKVADSRRIRMFYKGRNLKNDNHQLRDEGFHSDVSSEILCVIGEPIKSSDYAADGTLINRESDEEDLDDDDDEDGEAASNAMSSAAGTSADAAKKKKKKPRRKKKTAKSPSPAVSTGTNTPLAEHLPVPQGSHPTHRSASPSRLAASSAASSRPQTPLTPQAKLAAISDKFHTELLPECNKYIENPPAEKDKRVFEHKKWTETILAQVLLKLDAVETEGDDDARAQRKALVKEVQGWLGKLDGVLDR